MTLLTVVTIAHNALDGLRVTRASVEAQTYPLLNHLVLDAASVDGTVAYLQVLDGDEHLRWQSEPDDGIYHALNKAIALVDTGYIVFLHAGDTFIDPESAADAMAAIAQAPDAPDLAIGWSRFVTEHETLPYVVGGATPKAVTSAHQATLFSAEFHKRELYDTGFQLAADYELFRRLANDTSVKLLRLPLVVTHFLFGGRSNNPRYDQQRFGERAAINERFGEPTTVGVRLRTTARTVVRRVAYRVLGSERAAVVFLRLACRRGNSGARPLPLGRRSVSR